MSQTAQLMKGNEAMAEAAIRAGCRFFAGYPITPQTEILEYLSWRMPEVGGTFVQTESELAGINMVHGAAATGARTLTSSSGPGFSLKQETISYLAAAELPAVIVDVMRLGIGLGNITLGQGDYFQAVKGGGHGGYHLPVFAPASVQEGVDLMVRAFEVADRHRTPVLILSDGAIGQMAEAVTLPDYHEHDPDQFDWALKGKGSRESTGHQMTGRNYTDFTAEEYGPHLLKRYAAMYEREQLWEEVCCEDADVILVSFGISSRVCKAAVRLAREKGRKVGLIRAVSLWPFPVKAMKKYNGVIRGYLVVEMNVTGQMVEDVRLNAGPTPVYGYPTGRFVAGEAGVLDMIEQLYAGKLKEEN